MVSNRTFLCNGTFAFLYYDIVFLYTLAYYYNTLMGRNKIKYEYFGIVIIVWTTKVTNNY